MDLFAPLDSLWLNTKTQIIKYRQKSLNLAGVVVTMSLWQSTIETHPNPSFTSRKTSNLEHYEGILLLIQPSTGLA